MLSPVESKILERTRLEGIVTLGDVTARGIHPEHVRRLVARGELLRVSRGVYIAADEAPPPHLSLAIAARRYPKGVVCLLSALNLHDLGDHVPHEVWLALPQGTAEPRCAYPPLRVVRFSGANFDTGIRTYETGSVSVSVYSPAKTVVDLFRFRNRTGLDVAVEALRRYLADPANSRDELCDCALKCRAANVLKPYMNALS